MVCDLPSLWCQVGGMATLSYSRVDSSTPIESQERREVWERADEEVGERTELRRYATAAEIARRALRVVSSWGRRIGTYNKSYII